MIVPENRSHAMIANLESCLPQEKHRGADGFFRYRHHIIDVVQHQCNTNGKVMFPRQGVRAPSAIVSGKAVE